MYPPCAATPANSKPTAVRTHRSIFSFGTGSETTPAVTRSKHTYPPRPVPLEQDWETIDASTIPADATSIGKVGNPKLYTVDDDAAAAAQPAAKLAERTDDTAMNTDNAEQVELCALSQPGIEDESILLSTASLKTPSRKPSTRSLRQKPSVPSLSRKPSATLTSRQTRSSSQRARSTTSSHVPSRVSSSARLAASSRSSIREQPIATAISEKITEPSLPPPTLGNDNAPVSRELQALDNTEAPSESVEVGGHSLRKTSTSPERPVRATRTQRTAKSKSSKQASNVAKPKSPSKQSTSSVANQPISDTESLGPKVVTTRSRKRKAEDAAQVPAQAASPTPSAIDAAEASKSQSTSRSKATSTRKARASSTAAKKPASASKSAKSTRRVKRT